MSIRDERRLLQNEMAELLGLSPSAYARIERNETQIAYDKLPEFSEKLGVPVQELLPDTLTITNHNQSHGHGGGVFFGNQYVYVGETEAIKSLNAQIEALKAELRKAQGE